jgi:hypothetical protein
MSAVRCWRLNSQACFFALGKVAVAGGPNQWRACKRMAKFDGKILPFFSASISLISRTGILELYGPNNKSLKITLLVHITITKYHNIS